MNHDMYTYISEMSAINNFTMYVSMGEGFCQIVLHSLMIKNPISNTSKS